MSHLEAAKRFLAARRGAKSENGSRRHELNELIPSILPFPGLPRAVVSPVDPSPTLAQLAAQRWGPALPADATGPCTLLGQVGAFAIDIATPDPERRRLAMEAIADQPGDADETGLDHFPRWCDTAGDQFTPPF
jgi:predicted dehydrogenase